MKDMTVYEFSKALHAGLGRCILFLESCADKEPYREAVLQACLNDYAYDGQCEGTRAWYTYKLLSCFNDGEYFFSRIQHKLREVLCWNGNVWEFEHLFDLVLEFAKNGYAPAKELVSEVYRDLLDCLADKKPQSFEVDYHRQWLEHVCIDGMSAGGAETFAKIFSDIRELCEHNDEYSIEDFDEIMNFQAQRAQTKTVKKSDKRQVDCDVDKVLLDIKRYDNTDIDGDWHTVALDIVNSDNTAFPIEAYTYVYTGLCACCRKSVVEAMRKHGLLTDELVQECLYDCYDETREWAKRIKN